MVNGDKLSTKYASYGYICNGSGKIALKFRSPHTVDRYSEGFEILTYRYEKEYA